MRFLQRYRQLPRSIHLLIAAGLLVNLVNAAFILILNIYMRKLGFDDAEIAAYNSYRFLGVLLLAFPLGIFIKGKPLKPFFLAATVVIPGASFLGLFAIPAGFHTLIVIAFLLWGIGLMLLQVCTLPFIMRATPEKMVSEAFSLNFSTWSLSMIVSGSLIALLGYLEQTTLAGFTIHWDEQRILQTIVFLSLGAFFLILRMREAPPRSPTHHFTQNFKAIRADYDWDLILKALTPTLMIAVGAGLTIPFVNLFFNAVFHIDSEDFSLIGSGTAVLVFAGMLLAPTFKRRFGFRVAILIPQSAAVLMLLMLAGTELFAHWRGALAIAILCYMFRQPLMNMAHPMTSELTMKYVGEKNQELISAINSSTWSASWFLSAKIFQFLRGQNMEYYQIFIITAILYAAGIFLYALLIREFERRKQVDDIPVDPLPLQRT